MHVVVRVAREIVRVVVLFAILAALLVLRLLLYPVQWLTGSLCVGVRLARVMVRELRTSGICAIPKPCQDALVTITLVGGVVWWCALTHTYTCSALAGIGMFALAASEFLERTRTGN